MRESDTNMPANIMWLAAPNLACMEEIAVGQRRAPPATKPRPAQNVVGLEKIRARTAVLYVFSEQNKT